MTEEDFYTRTPFKLPARVDGSTREVAPVIIEGLDRELLDCYMAEHEISERIASAFLAFDLEPPTNAAILSTGFTTRQSRVLDATAPSTSEQLGEYIEDES